MATSLKNPPATENTSSGAKKYLDFAGLNTLWDNICDKFSPQWKTVNFEHLSTVPPTHNESNIILTFRNLSVQPTSEGVINHTQLNQIEWTLDAAKKDATTGEYVGGILSAADKKKIDEIGDTSENAVTVKDIKVGNQLSGGESFNATSLKVAEDGTKTVAFGLNYDASTDELSIIDLINDNKKLSSVKILEDAFKDAVFKDADVISKEGQTYLTFTLTITSQTGETEDKVLEINVNDLVSVYEAGDGIALDVNNDSVTDDNETSVKISVVAPKVVSNDNKIGGIKPNNIYSESNVSNWKNTKKTGTAPAIQDLGTATGRYFGIETDKDGHAFVNVPSASISAGTTSTKTGSINNTESADTFTAMTGISMELSADGKSYTYVPEITTYTLAQESELSVNSGANHTVSNSNATIGETATTINYIQKIEVDGDHNLKITNGSYTLTDKDISINGDANGESITLTPGAQASTVTVLKDIAKDGHHVIQKETMSISVADPESIDIDYIEGLVWSIPITKKHFPNETTT